MELIRDELRRPVSASFLWKVREISPTEFAMAFPSADIVRICTQGGMIILPIHKIKLDVRTSTVDPKASPSHVSVWLHIHGIPDEARMECIIMVIFEAIGKLMVVDKLSLIRTGPGRMKVQCPDPTTPGCRLQFYFGDVGRIDL